MAAAAAVSLAHANQLPYPSKALLVTSCVKSFLPLPLPLLLLLLYY